MRSRPGSTPAPTAATPRRATTPGSASGAGSSGAWTGAASSSERVARWYRQLHIFLYPFYYIEYGIAQIGALQIWRNSLTDPVRAVANYREALALGAVRSLPEMYRAAGARLSFDAGVIGALVELVEEQIERIRSQLPGGAS